MNVYIFRICAVLLFASSTLNAANINELETSVSFLGARSKDYDGYGVSLKADWPLSSNKRHYIGVEGDFLKVKSR